MHVHVAGSAVPLARCLAEVLSEPLEDPMTPEWVAVPSEGMRRWLSLSLARHLGAREPGLGDGIAANITFAFPGSLRLRVLDSGRPVDDPDPWQVEGLAWTVLRVLDDTPGDSRLAALQRTPAGGSRFSRARRVADLFDRYHLYRAGMIRGWAVGRDVDGAGQVLADHHRWQPHLWRLTRDRLAWPSPPERLPDLLADLSAGRLDLDLPERVALFGLTLLPGGSDFLELAEAIGVRRDLHLFLTEPSPAAAARLRRGGAVSTLRPAEVPAAHPLLRSWGRLACDTPLLLAGDVPISSLDAPSPRRGAPGPPTPSSFVPRPLAVGQVEVMALPGLGPGPDSEQLDREQLDPRQGAVATGVEGVRVEGVGAGGLDLSHPPSSTGGGGVHGAVPPATLLGRLQWDVRWDLAPAGDLRPAAHDHSVQFHACHGPARQVEVLRDALLHCLAEDPTLQEDDIVVLCPSLERFAPLVEAVFGPAAPGASARSAGSLPAGSPSTGSLSAGSPPADSSGEDGGVSRAPSLRYRIADRSVRTASSLLGAVDALLDLVGGRFESTTVLDFITLGPVRERFRLTDDDLARIREWVVEANVRWGLDPPHRQPLGLPATITTNTWQAAVDRLLMGSAVLADQPSETVGDVVPLGVEGDDAALAGRFAELIQRLAELAVACRQAHPLAAWITLLREASAGIVAVTGEDAWQDEAFRHHLDQILAASELSGTGYGTPLALIDVRRVLADHLDAVPGRPDFFRGGITISSMNPLRWVPYRVVCLLGADQAGFTAGAADGDDLLGSSAALLGDRDARGEAREALLEAVLAAGDRLIIVRDGHDVRTNQPIPPAVVVAELRDAALACVHPGVRDGIGRRLEVHHPRQPFDERCFQDGQLGVSGPWSYEPLARAGAIARRNRRPLRAAFLSEALEPEPLERIELADLHTFFRDPTRGFVEGRLGVRLPREELELPVLSPVALSGMARWQVGDRVLAARLRGVPFAESIRMEERMGTLPPGVLGQSESDELERLIEGLATEAFRLGAVGGPVVAQPIDVVLDDRTRLVGSVPVQRGTDQMVTARITYSRERPGYRVAAWLDLMALVVEEPFTRWRAAVVATPQSVTKKRPVAAYTVDPKMDEADGWEAARRALGVAIDCYRRGHREPLPLFPTISSQVASGRAWSDPSIQKMWRRDHGSPGDGQTPAAKLVYGERPWKEVRAVPARDDDPAGAGGRAERYARYVWGAIGDSVRFSDDTGASEGEAVPGQKGVGA